jgi:hypothetical protein
MRAAFALAILIGTTAAAFANGAFEIAIPGRPGVPVIINGVDASYAVVEGDWGLGQGPQMQTTVYGGRYIDPVPNVGHYYPSAGHQPGYGRLEVEPPANRRLPQSGEIYYRSWSAQSARPAAQPEVPLYPPEIIVAPHDDNGRLRKFRPPSQKKFPH